MRKDTLKLGQIVYLRKDIARFKYLDGLSIGSMMIADLFEGGEIVEVTTTHNYVHYGVYGKYEDRKNAIQPWFITESMIDWDRIEKEENLQND